MSDLVLDSEPLNRIAEGRKVTKEHAFEIFNLAKDNPSELYNVAAWMRNKHKKKTVTFSKKAFFNLVNLCRDTCGYCTYKAEPASSKLSMMSKNEVRELARLARKYKCTEALFVTGERPEQKYAEARKWLKDNGFSSTPEYLVHASEIALSEGLFPHTNAGNLSKSELAELKKTNVSMGLMLESASQRLMQDNMPHHLAPSKNPKERINALRNAGELKIPMTTGILLGIGETPEESIESIFAISALHEQYSNIQEIILQNFQPKHDTIMRKMPSAEENYFKIMVAMTRVIMPEMNIQIPPNLSPRSYQRFLEVGINDWGGISPLTSDYVNPEFAWPEISFVDENCRMAGFELKARLPVYPEFISMTDSGLHEKIAQVTDTEGLVKTSYWK
ncbi:7,8-didemethyl-8-hydroxy-5-deazariboflavin synthase subunit CofG [Candidatus Nitrosotenuis uzonensis]|uniref:7,8-didemethyl-8-hydroxy-5-deazariboflavin synthase n=1 Tax=Candidatus Nitrosotenuis uzonensis TaxID=1407055 RepID=A0A812F6H2_9ARCH|nr:7,8-didemethyl-8-hydroxy-5-deazariboflavin synthase subunit CofG [Candidatus Nitrosotenuis uzonensis]CAE6501917.1 FO synthase subunit 1 [Candidatus Nitrosotenuis uzonensis]